MVFRLPDHILNQVLVRLALGEPVRTIHNALDVSRQTIYTIEKNVNLWGVPYPPATVRMGREMILAPYQREVTITSPYRTMAANAWYRVFYPFSTITLLHI